MEHGLLMLEGGGIYRLGDALVSGAGGRLHLDGAVLPAVVRRARQAPAKYLIYKDWNRHPASHAAMTIDSRLTDRLVANSTLAQYLRRAAARRHAHRLLASRTCVARAYVKGLCADAGLAIREDAVGNTFARWAGTEPDLPPSAPARTSTPFPMPDATTARSACSAGWKPSARCSAAGFTAAPLDRTDHLHRRRAHALRPRMSGQPPDGRHRSTRRRLRALQDSEGQPLDDVRRAAGFSGLARVRRCPPATMPRSWNCTSSRARCWNAKTSTSAWSRPSPPPPACASSIEGEGGHAGAVLMPDRHDALRRRRRNRPRRGSAPRDPPAPSIPSAPSASATSSPAPSTASPAASRLEIDVRDIDARPPRRV